jgi:hypothetical protein
LLETHTQGNEGSRHKEAYYRKNSTR